MRGIFILVLAAVIFSSCRSTRKIQTAISRKDTTATVRIDTTQPAPSKDTVNQTAKVLAALDKQRIDFKTFSAKIDVDYVGGNGKKENVNVKLQMQKDSIIWLSVTGLFGIEGLRGIITKDSVKLINKIDKLYTLRSVAYLQEVTGLPLDLAILQDLLIGNPVFISDEKNSVTQTGAQLLLLSIGESFKNLLTLTPDNYQLLHSKLDDVDVNRNRTCDLSYDNYENKKGVNFSTKRRITVSEKSKLDIRLDFKSYTFNETLSFPFSVPRNYKQN
ncbi:DUF4292 domain-containing protein [Terrimonas ferruginea]|uniref:DUF4292 domain-containing protein n=1 Tax=Terrimonas ferruginea TaxID=249 RepID=UPI00041A8A97|nr:DUF4292 domain-containing protein [Terrimonas ferruginea]